MGCGCKNKGTATKPKTVVKQISKKTPITPSKRIILKKKEK